MATRDVGNLRTRLSWEDQGTNRSLQGFNRDLRGLRSELNEVNSRGRDFTNSLKGMRQQSDILTRRLDTQRQKVQELRRRYEESRRVKGEDAEQTKNLARQYNNARAQMNRTEQQLEGLNAEIRRQINPWNRLGETLERNGRRFQTIGQNMTQFGRTATMRVTTPIMGMAAAALKVAADFEEGMAEVQAISGATADEMQQLEEQARSLGETTRFSATEAASAQRFLAMAGFETNEILASMPGLLDLAAASNMELGRAADITSNILSGFNMEADEAGRVSDVLARGASTANTTVEQLGGAMQYVAPVAQTLGLEVEELVASVGFLSDAGIQGEQAGRQLRMGLLRLANPTGKAAGLIDELGINVFDAEGNMRPMSSVVEELNKGLQGMSSDARAAALSTLFGAESTAGWSVLLENGADDLATYTEELENSEGAASEMAEVMNDSAKGSVREFQSALESAGIAVGEHLLPIFTDLVEKATDIIRRFGELDREQQQQILMWAGIAAAIGPVSIALGGLTTTIGGILRVGGSLATLIGRASGAGLLGRLAGLGLGGPVGLAVGGVSALGGVIYALTRNTEDLNEVNFETVQRMHEEVEATDSLISKFEDLQNQNRLTTDEMLEYMDILSELEKTASPQRIEELTERQEQLLEKSGLTNEEMNTFLELNDQVIDKAPATAQAISEEGNAYADNLQSLRDLNEEKRRELQMTAERELVKALENEVQLLEREEELVESVNQKRQEYEDAHAKYMENQTRIVELEREREGIYADLERMQANGLDMDDEAFRKKQELLGEVAKELQEEREIEYTLEQQVNEAEKILNEKQGSLEKTREELKELDNLKYDYEQIVLSHAGINSEKGKGLQAIDKEIDRIRDQKKELQEQLNTNTLSTAEYQSQVSELDEQLSRLDRARQDLIKINELAAETAYEKNIRITTNPDLGYINRQIASDVTKRVNVQVGAYKGPQMLGYASGTDHHPGGPFIAGEEGFELGRLGNRWEMLDFGMYNRPTGYQVFPHDESKRILQAMNRLPGYADGARPLNEMNRVIGELGNNSLNDSNSQIVALLREIARGVKEGKVVQISNQTITDAVNETNAVDGLGKFF